MYSSKEYFLNRIDQTELSKLTKSNDANLNSAISTADSLIDSYLSAVVPVPLNFVPDIIKQISYDIAVFYLHDRIQYKDIPERIKDKYDAAVFILKDFAQGKAEIPGLPAEDKEGSITYECENKIFDRNSI
jgi:phage gp36-like protein